MGGCNLLCSWLGTASDALRLRDCTSAESGDLRAALCRLETVSTAVCMLYDAAAGNLEARSWAGCKFPDTQTTRSGFFVLRNEPISREESYGVEPQHSSTLNSSGRRSRNPRLE